MSTATATKLTEVLGAQGLHTIGALVFWTLNGVRIPRDELGQALEDLGLGSAMVRKPKPEAALAEAVRRVGVGKKGILFRQMKREWAIVQERGEGERLKFEHAATLRIKPQGDGWIVACDRHLPQVGPVLSDPINLLAEAVSVMTDQVLSTCHSTDLSAVLCNAMQGVGTDMMLGGLSLRQSTGGLYYVSAGKVELLKRFAAMVNDKAPQSSIEVLTLTGDTENLETAARNVRGNITTQLKQTREEIREFVAKLKQERRGARGDSITVRAETFKQLKSRVGMFADVLGDSLGELQGQIETARQELMAELEGA